MDVFYIKAALTPHLKKRMEELGLVEGAPYTLTDSFGFDREINSFLSFLVTPAAPSPNTWKSYAEQLSLFLRYMDARGKPWKETAEADLKAYWRERRLSGEVRKPVSASSWRSFVAVAIKFFEWAHASELIQHVPFSYKALQTAWGSRQLPQLSIAEPVRGKEVKYVNAIDFRNRFYPALQGTRNGIRDGTFGALLLSTGLRLNEANNLTLSQLPDPDDSRYQGRKTCVVKIIGKGNKLRLIRIPKTILRDIHHYVRTERQDTACRLKENYPAQKASDRVFLARTGGPISNRRWEAIFQAAGRACGLPVHPHMLRHSFAIYQLSSMVHHHLKQTSAHEDIQKGGTLFKDPMRQLQRLMGHSHITTTYIYLDYIQEAEDMVEGALSDWTSSVFGDGDGDGND